LGSDIKRFSIKEKDDTGQFVKENHHGKWAHVGYLVICDKIDMRENRLMVFDSN